MDKPAIITLSKRWEHHTKSGGYDRLKEDVSSLDISPKNKAKYVFSALTRRRVLNKLMPATRYVNGYQLKDLIAELRCIRASNFSKNSVIHSLYGEDQLLLLLQYRQLLKGALVATFHLPPESPYMQNVLNTGHYKQFNNLDAAVVLCNSMVPELEKWVGTGNVFYVPHGIDCEVFKPDRNIAHQKKEGLNILTVGGHGRDWNVLTEVVEAFSNDSDVTFTVVAPTLKAPLFSGRQNVLFLTGIDEDELIRQYQKSDIVFIPVTFASANNSVLEALACGKPVISTNTGGISDYVDGQSGWLLPPGDTGAAIELINALKKGRIIIVEKTKAARKRALDFSWVKIAQQMHEVYHVAFERYQSKGGKHR